MHRTERCRGWIPLKGGNHFPSMKGLKCMKLSYFCQSVNTGPSWWLPMASSSKRSVRKNWAVCSCSHLPPPSRNANTPPSPSWNAWSWETMRVSQFWGSKSQKGNPSRKRRKSPPLRVWSKSKRRRTLPSLWLSPLWWSLTLTAQKWKSRRMWIFSGICCDSRSIISNLHIYHHSRFYNALLAFETPQFVMVFLLNFFKSTSKPDATTSSTQER